MSWITDIVNTVRIGVSENTKQKSIPEGLWSKCPSCQQVVLSAKLTQNLFTCSKCNHHMPLSARLRLQYFLDTGSTQEILPDLLPLDALKFKDSKKYTQRISQDQSKTDEKDALIAMQGTLYSMPVVACAFEFKFMGGSMGSVVGEKFVQAAQIALEKKCPFICFAASGGARMQENMFSLMQMARTAAAIERLKQQGQPYISVLTNPTFGGVSASLAMLGDINIAEPNALIGFAGPKVIEQTVKQKLPDGFQKSEFLLEHGVLDTIMHRKDLRIKIADLLAILTHQQPVAMLPGVTTKPATTPNS